MEEKILIKNLIEMEKFAEKFLRNFSANLKQNNQATIITLSGDLGSGKTTFVQKIGKILKINEKIKSPTFVISKTHTLKHPIWKKLIHVDAYRLSKTSDIKNIGLDIQMENMENIIFIEWPEMIKNELKKNENKINLIFEHISENERNIQFKKYN